MNRRISILDGVLLAVVVFIVSPAWAQEDRAKSIDFARDVQPILESHCYSCHGPNKQESNFRLDVKVRALGQGDFGEKAIVPGDSQASPLINYVSKDPDLQMPPEGEGKPLTKAQVEMLSRWIDQGAIWPDELANAANEKISTKHWSFLSVRKPEVPNDSFPASEIFPIANPIDGFIARKLEKAGLAPSASADKRTLIRRLYLIMHGLQPSPEQIEIFLADESPDAYTREVDRVLASHHYGERWARHWLDVVRFGESTGYEVNRDRNNAFYYRDYVIEALNTDKSYKDFVVEQLAGDAVGVDEATGFLVGGPNDIVKSPDINLTLMQREDELADYVNTTSTTFLGLTVGCARCHNHKFDPILQSDYYSMQAVFAGVQHGERQLTNRLSPEDRSSLDQIELELLVNEQELDRLRSDAPVDKSINDLAAMVNAGENTDSFEPVSARFLKFDVRETNSVEPCIDELEIFGPVDENNLALASAGALVTSSGNYEGNPKHQLKHLNDGRFGNDFSWISNTVGKGWVQIEFPEAFKVSRVVWGRDRTGGYADRLGISYTIQVSEDGETWQEVSSSKLRKPFLINGKETEDAFVRRLSPDKAELAIQLLEAVRGLRESQTNLKDKIPTGYVGTFKKPALIHRLYRGDPMSPKEVVVPDTLQVMGTLKLNNQSPEQQRRLKFARWVASEQNPLTARVIVNRVWHYHFGRGIVSTPSDFGLNGQNPTHPELLDWLASEFMENGWSLKWLHRQILMSSVYQQSSTPRQEGIEKDADGRLLWRFPPRRLEAEAIRDCVLQATGKLNPETGGPGFLLFKIDRENVHHYFPLEKFESEHFRRMIYMTKIRQEQDEVFGVFDCPDGGQSIPDRSRSTTALQALNLLNSRFMLEQADFFAERLKQASKISKEQVRLAYELTFSRSPNSEEINDAVTFINENGLAAFCRAILNANEFLFVS